jgi:anti-sigma regulatory factor (Ser/Thr protein kinase)
VSASATVAPEAGSVSAARRFVTETLMDVPVEVLAVVQMMVSELATNAVEHVRTNFDLSIRTTSRAIRVEVTDHGGGTPTRRTAGPGDLRGRGLQIVDMLSTNWGVEHRAEPETTVWFTVAMRPKSGPPPRQPVASMR